MNSFEEKSRYLKSQPQLNSIIIIIIIDAQIFAGIDGFTMLYTWNNKNSRYSIRNNHYHKISIYDELSIQ
ncbi:hypothetical protein DERF_006763 [Dermatophagoides farinae]|uniref:Uncharacterized protein n=1 Tax=Dermatophagoides farinae TaxID=6954 RepID=A0A922L2E5_DERFA|nr:hypothetical protein DERF_006763 [Dermatophagoides farinae]